MNELYKHSDELYLWMVNTADFYFEHTKPALEKLARAKSEGTFQYRWQGIFQDLIRRAATERWLEQRRLRVNIGRVLIDEVRIGSDLVNHYFGGVSDDDETKTEVAIARATVSRLEYAVRSGGEG